MSSDYSEVSLECPHDLPPVINDAYKRLCIALETARSTTAGPAAPSRAVKDGTANSGYSAVSAYSNYSVVAKEEAKEENEETKLISALQDWCNSPLVESDAQGNKSMDELTEKGPRNFPIYKELDEIVKTLHTTDVVCLIAPTGSGKSILSPFIAEKLARCADLKGSKRAYRKTLLVVPNVEHCGSTARTFGNLFGRSKIALSAFLNPYEEKVPREGGYLYKKSDFRSNHGPAEFAICTYQSALRVLPKTESCLNLLILDEVHQRNHDVQLTLAMARKKLLGEPFSTHFSTMRKQSQTLKKLLLMTATLDEKERKECEKYFTSRGLSFKILDLTDKLQRMKQITMSCLPGTPLPPMFEVTPHSERLFREVPTLRITDASMDHNALHNRMSGALEFVMGLAGEDLRSRLSVIGSRTTPIEHMQSIIVILPGLDHVDRMYNTTFNLPNFNFNGLPGFHPVRLTSLVKDDMSVTSMCSLIGSWQKFGRRGRIVLTTNLVAAGLTVPNCAYVIDSGLQKMPSEYTKNGLKKLETTLIDKMMITQRAGRTGRTTDGEYFLPYSVEKVDEMMTTDHGELMLHRNFDERHALYTEVYDLRPLLHAPPERLRQELLDCMTIRGLYSTRFAFAKGGSVRMNDIFNFLSPEQARIVILGTRLGIAAHAIYLVADSISRVKFCQVGTVGRGNYHGPSVEKSTAHLFGEAMDQAKNDGGNWPGKYAGIGDSIALADLLVGFFSVVPCNFNREALNEIPVPSNNFWSGNIYTVAGWSPSLAKMYATFVRDEGHDAVARFVTQIESCLRAADMLPPASHGRAIFDKEFNRHLVSRDNFCLNEDGRALLAALLTMNSSRVGELKQKSYGIYCEKSTEPHIKSLFPESTYSQPTVVKTGEMIYGRYTDMFERRGKYCGLIDPITLKQLAFFMNINGQIIITMNAITLTLNASNAKRGIKIQFHTKVSDNVLDARGKLKESLDRLTRRADKALVAALEAYIAGLWRECGGKMERRRDEKDMPLAAAAANAMCHPPPPSRIFPRHPPPSPSSTGAPPAYSQIGNSTRPVLSLNRDLLHTSDHTHSMDLSSQVQYRLGAWNMQDTFEAAQSGLGS